MHPLRLISKAQSELDRGCCGRAGADSPVFILVGRWESRSKVLAVIAVTYELGPPDITETPERRATAACGMLSEGGQRAGLLLNMCTDVKKWPQWIFFDFLLYKKV